jgi:hypothetical protein
MSSFNKTYDFRYNNNYIIRPFNNKYFIYENKYLIRYEYYNIILTYLRNKNIYNLQYMVNTINKKKYILEGNNEKKQNDKTNYVNNMKNNTNNQIINDQGNIDDKEVNKQIIIKKNENIDNKQISKQIIEKNENIDNKQISKQIIEKNENIDNKQISKQIIEKNENIDSKQIKQTQIDKDYSNKYDYSKKSFQEYYQERSQLNSNEVLCIDKEKNIHNKISPTEKNQVKNNCSISNETNINNNIFLIKNIQNQISHLDEDRNNLKINDQEKIITQDEIIVKIQEDLLKKIWNYKIQDRLSFFSKMKYVRKFNYEHNYSVDVGLLENYVVRKVLKYSSLGFVLFKSEVTALLKLNKYPHFPKILTFDPKRYIIYMSYCGEPINNQNCPDDWYYQFGIISEIMKKENTTSSDIIDRNICVLNKKIHIIDFGLSNQFSESVDVSINKLYKILYKYGKNKKYIDYE